MNLSDQSNMAYHTNTTTSSNYRSLTAAGDHLYAHVSTSQPGTQAWSLRVFFATAVPLAVITVIFPLIAGPIFRSIARYARRHPYVWRFFVGLAFLRWVDIRHHAGLSLILPQCIHYDRHPYGSFRFLAIRWNCHHGDGHPVLPLRFADSRNVRQKSLEETLLLVDHPGAFDSGKWLASDTFQ